MWIALKSIDAKAVRAAEKKLPPELAQALAAGRLSHAVLIAGPDAAGQTAARLAAKALLCPDRQGAAACGICRSCTSFEAGANPDFVPVVADKSIKVDQVRALREAAQLHPLGQAGIAVVIEQADSMTPQAQNALLKLLEEPPPRFTILLQTQRPAMLLDTILSRVTRYELEAGRERTAQRREAVQLLELLAARDYAGLLAMQPKLSAGRPTLVSFCEALCLLCRDLLRLRADPSVGDEELRALAARVPAAWATSLPKLATDCASRAEGGAYLALLATAFLIDCWEEIAL